MELILKVFQPSFIFFYAYLSLSLAQALPANFTLTNILPTVVQGTSILQTADTRLFITELGGDLKTYKSGTSYTLHHFPTSNARSEQGLFGLVADPNYATNGWMYVHYFVFVNGGDQDYHVVMRFTLANPLGGNPTYVDGSEYLIYRLPNLPAGNSRHNGGHITFGSDGYLYICKGEGEHQEQAEILTNVFGKLIRIDAHSNSASNSDIDGHYGIPAGNAGLAKPEIFAYGFRNPWSLSKDPSSEDIYIGDVGGTEEINRVIPSLHVGKKFGWGAGGNSGMFSCGDATYVCPMVAYDGGAVTGVAVKRNIGGNWPAEYINTVFYSDHNGRWIKYTPIGQNNPVTFDANGDQPLGLTFGEVDGNLYYCTYNRNGLWQVRYDGVVPVAPAIVTQPVSKTVHSGNTTTFAVVASGTPLNFKWQSAPVGSTNFTDLVEGAIFTGVATANLSVKPTVSQAGNYRVVISNTAGSVTSNTVVLAVLPPDFAPSITFNAPAQGSFFTVPNPINFSATANDPEQGNLPPSAFHWDLELAHRTSPSVYHTHPITFYDATQTGNFASTVGGEPSNQVWLLLICTVTDSAGNIDKDTLTLFPNLVPMTAKSVPPGLNVVAMELVKTDTTFNAVIGNDGRINANSPQIINGVRYDFDHWVFGGTVPSGLNTTTPFQTFIVPTTTSIFTAYYNATPVATVYSIKAVNNNYATLLADNRVQPNSATVTGNSQLFEMYDNGDATLYLKALGNGKYCQATGDADMTCDLATVSSAAAKWTLVDNGNGTKAVKNAGSLKYMVAEGGGGAPLKANRANVSGWESFTFAVQAAPTPQYGITLAVSGGAGTTSPTIGTTTQVSSGGSLNITATPGAGMIFDHWTVSAGSTIANALSANTQITNVSAAGTVTAFFIAAPQYGITLATGSGTGTTTPVTGTTTQISSGGSLNITATPGAGMVFDHWNVSAGLTIANANSASTQITNVTVAGTVYAYFVPFYGITLAVSGTGTTTPAVGTTTQIISGGNLNITATPGAGMVFDHWNVSAGLTIASTTSASTQITNVSAAGTVTAFFIAAPPTNGTKYAFKATNNQYVTLLADNKLNPNSTTIAGNNQLLEVGSNGDGTVYIKAVGNNLYCQATGANDVTCDAASATANAAKWTQVNNANGSTSFKNIGTAGHLVAEGGGGQPLKANRANISGWESFTITVQVPQGPQYGITMAVSGTGTTAPAVGTTTQVSSGGSLNVIATPGAGMKFDHWTVSAGLAITSATTASTQITNVTVAGTVTAYFIAIPQYGITLAASGTGTTAPAVGTTTQVTSGNNLSVTATPSAGMLFDHWTVSAGLTITSTTSATTQITNVTVAGTVTAYFVTAPLGTRYSFKAVNNQYVTLQADTKLIPNSTTVAGNNQLFEIGSNADATLYIKSLGNGLYCQATGANDVTCDLASVSIAAAKWTQTNNANGTKSFKNSGTNGYLVAENGGGAPLKANRANISGWESFTLLAQ